MSAPAASLRWTWTLPARVDLFGLWLAAAAASLLAGELSAVSFGGQSGRILWVDLILALGAAVALARARGVIEIPRAGFLDALWLLAACGAASLLIAGDPLTALAELKEWLVALVAAVAALHYGRDPVRVRRLLACVALAGVGVAAHMAWVALHARVPWVLAVLMKQVDLPWGRTNYLAGILVLSTTVALGLAVSSANLRGRLAWSVAALVCAVGLLLSASKGAMLALVAGLVLVVLGPGRRAGALPWLTLALVAVGVFAFSFGPLRAAADYRLEAGALAYSMDERLRLYTLGWELFLAHPLTGVGLNNFSVAANSLHGIDTVPHNLELGFLAELGLPGLALILWWVVALLAVGWSAVRHATNPRQRALAAALLACMLQFVVHNQVESTLYGQQYKILFLWVAAAAWCLRSGKSIVDTQPGAVQ